MLTSGRGFRCSLFGLLLGGIYFGFGGMAIAWIQPPEDYPDVDIGGGSANQMATDPANPNHLVIGGSRLVWSEGRQINQCAVYTSADGGETWSLAAEPSECTYQVAVTYARSGGVIYAVYGNSSGEPGINFSSSIDQGVTWSAPTIVASPLGRWTSVGSVRLAEGPDGSVYASFSVSEPSPSGSYCDGLYVSASTNEGASWSDARHVESRCWENGEGFGRYSVAAGGEGTIIIAYVLDSWQPGHAELEHDYTLQIAKSSDYGASFAYGTIDRFSSNGFAGLSDPLITIAPRGLARLVYVKEEAAILYKKSPPPYDNWRAKPVRLNPKMPGESVGSPRLAVGVCGNTNILHAAWRGSATFYTRKIALPGYRWSRPLQISPGFPGSSIGLTAAGAEAFAVSNFVYFHYAWWTRLYGSRVWSGVTCP